MDKKTMLKLLEGLEDDSEILIWIWDDKTQTSSVHYLNRALGKDITTAGVPALLLTHTPEFEAMHEIVED